MAETVITLANVGLPDLEKAARSILGHLPAGISVVCFNGQMGAGKTTFIKVLCQALGVTENVSSPTYSLVNEYETADGKRICHFDFYRIRNQQEAAELGTTEYFSSGDLCLVEWPSEIPDLLPDHFAQVLIEAGENEKRTISLTLY